MSQPWEQQEGEPLLWFARFEKFVVLRSINLVYRQELEEQGKTAGKNAPGSWRIAAKNWNWNDRVKAWDDAQWQAVKPSETILLETPAQREDRWLVKQVMLRDRAYRWVEDYLLGKIVTETTTDKRVDDPMRGEIVTKMVTRTPVPPPQWLLERFIGRSDHEKQLTVMYSAARQVLAIEGDAPELQRAKILIQGAIEGLLLEAGADSVRTLLSLKA